MCFQSCVLCFFEAAHITGRSFFPRSLWSLEKSLPRWAFAKAGYREAGLFEAFTQAICRLARHCTCNEVPSAGRKELNCFKACVHVVVKSG